MSTPPSYRLAIYPNTFGFQVRKKLRVGWNFQEVLQLPNATDSSSLRQNFAQTTALRPKHIRPRMNGSFLHLVRN